MYRLYIDIGRRETKITEVLVKGSTYTVIKTAEMRDMSDYVTKYGGIKAMGGFCLSLKKTLDDASIKTKEAFVCSSIFGIQHVNITKNFEGLPDCRRNFSRKYGAKAESSMICDWQFFGETFKNAEIKQQLRMAACPYKVLQDFVRSMRDKAQINVVGIESPFSAASHLLAMHTSDYAVPSTCIVSVTSEGVDYQFYKDDALITTAHTDSKLARLGNLISERCEVSLHTAIGAMYRVGVGYNDSKAGSKLVPSGISFSEYLRTIEEAVDDFIGTITQEITATSARCNLETVHIIFVGGILAMTGIADMVLKRLNNIACTLAEIKDVFSCRGVIVENATNQPLTSKFGCCVGLMLRGTSVHPLNLYSALKLKKNVDKLWK